MQRIAEPDRIQLEFSSLFSKVILASSSPNRKKLLEDAGVDVSVFIPEADESRIGDTPEEIVRSIARRKMEAYLSSNEYRDDIPAIAADTLVLIDEELLGKPSDEADAYAMLGMGAQYAIAVPSKDMVIVTTADTQADKSWEKTILSVIWKIVDSAEDNPLPEDSESYDELLSLSSDQSIPVSKGGWNRAIADKLDGKRDFQLEEPS